MGLSSRRGPAASQCRDRRADRAACRREPRLRIPADPRRAAQARSPGQCIHYPPDPQGTEDPAGAETAHGCDVAAVPAHASRDDARHRLLPRRLRGHPPAPVCLVRNGDRLPLRAHPRRDQAMDHPADPEPLDGPRRSHRRFPVSGSLSGTGPGSSVRRSTRSWPMLVSKRSRSRRGVLARIPMRSGSCSPPGRRSPTGCRFSANGTCAA